MAISREKKQEIIETLSKQLSEVKGGVIVDPYALKVNEIEEIRKALKAKDTTFKVVKKTLTRIASKNANFELPETALQGSLAFALSSKDEIAPAKIIWEQSKKYENLKILGGIFNKQFIPAEEVSRLGQIPSTDLLYAKLVGTIAAPVSRVLNVLKANQIALINILSAYNQQKTN